MDISTCEMITENAAHLSDKMRMPLTIHVVVRLCIQRGKRSLMNLMMLGDIHTTPYQ